MVDGILNALAAGGVAIGDRPQIVAVADGNACEVLGARGVEPGLREGRDRDQGTEHSQGDSRHQADLFTLPLEHLLHLTDPIYWAKRLFVHHILASRLWVCQSFLERMFAR